MPLEAPNLDTRTFDQLVAEARRRIPRYAPEWTDFNDSDPGMTLVQLFAWLTEMMLYQANRIPERNYITFLQLMGQERRPAQPAIAHLTFTPQPGAGFAAVRAGTQLQAQPPAGGDPVIFETVEGLDLVRLPLASVQVFDGSAFTDVTELNATPGTGFLPFGTDAPAGSAIYFGFAQSDPPSPGPVFPQEVRLGAFLPATGRGSTYPAPPTVEVVWEYKPAPPSAPLWRRLNVLADETQAFAADGYIRLEGPRDATTSIEGKGSTTPLYWLRARIASGAFAAGVIPKVDFIRFNVTAAKALAAVTEEILGTSEGVADQVFTLQRRPVEPGSLELVSELDGQQTPWTLVDDLLDSGRDSRSYVLNTNRGEIRFGDGVHGLIPEAGATIVAARYRFGGGASGNVPKGAVSTILSAAPGVAEVTNERPAVGGRDEQSLKEIKREAPRFLRARNRAVTVDDFATLAATAGGVAKATAIGQAHPGYPGVKVPGAVSVVIVPDTLDRPPVPPVDLIRSVAAYMERFRLLGTELFVTEPEYKKISVEALVSAKRFASFALVERDVLSAIDAYLDPQSWPFGEDLQPTNLYGVIRAVEGVSSVPRLEVRVDGVPHAALGEAIEASPMGLFYGGGHDIVVRPEVDR